MEERAKQRLVGVAVVVTLLVIFLPMLLEEEVLHSVSEREMSIPPWPNMDPSPEAPMLENPAELAVSTFPEYEEPIPPEELPPPVLPDVSVTEESEHRPEPILEPIGKLPPEPETAPIPAPETPPRVEPKPKPKVAPAKKPARTQPQPPAATRTPTDISSWVIQVASLQEHARAYALVEKLRAKGFPAFIQEARVQQKLWHRVRIGPELGRVRIESMATSLQTKTGLKGQIQRYP